MKYPDGDDEEPVDDDVSMSMADWDEHHRLLALGDFDAIAFECRVKAWRARTDPEDPSKDKPLSARRAAQLNDTDSTT